MKIANLRTLILLLFAVLMLLSAPAVADGGTSEVTLTICEVGIVKDSSAQDIVFSINGVSGTTSAFVAQGGSVTISVSSIPSGKNLIVSHEGDAVLTSSGLTITVSNVQSELVTVTMKLESAGTGGGGGSITPTTPDTPINPDTPGDEPDTPDDEPETKSHTALVGDDGDAHFKDHEFIIRVTVPEKYAGEKIEVIDGASEEAAEGMDVYHQADICLHFELEDGDKAIVHFQIPASEFKAKGLTENDACLYHYSEKDGWTKLPTWHYSIEDGYLIYESETDDFSPFAIVFEKDSAMPKSSEPTEEPRIPCWLIAVLGLAALAGIGIVIAGRRRK
ncbi:MAG: PGF-pre-PGF domain-containing protein [Methanocorpusculum sp.]|nr:PGF-pre-PGF domain-containing protein [Methanocorpusculum sp.]